MRGWPPNFAGGGRGGTKTGTLEKRGIKTLTLIVTYVWFLEEGFKKKKTSQRKQVLANCRGKHLSSVRGKDVVLHKQTGQGMGRGLKKGRFVKGRMKADVKREKKKVDDCRAQRAL